MDHLAAELYSGMLNQLIGIDTEEGLTFFIEAKEGSSIMSERGFAFIEASETNARTFECYAEKEGSARFQSGEWPVSIECRRGTARLLFTGEQFFGLPVLVEFKTGTMFGLPPLADCKLDIEAGTTLLFTSFGLSEGDAEPSMSFQPIAEVLLHLAVHDALEPLPGLNTKGLRLDLGSKS